MHHFIYGLEHSGYTYNPIKCWFRLSCTHGLHYFTNDQDSYTDKFEKLEYDGASERIFFTPVEWSR